MQNQQGVVFATAGYDHSIRFWDCTTGACTKSVKIMESQVNSLAISSDKKFVAAACNPGIKVYDVSRGDASAPIASLEGHTGNVTNVGFDADGKWLFSGGEDGTVRVWDFRASTKECQRMFVCDALSATPAVMTPTQSQSTTQQQQPRNPPAAPSERNNWSEARKNCVNSVVLHPNQVELVSGDAGGRVNLFDMTGKESGAVLSIQSPDEGAVRSVAIAGDGSRVFFATDGGSVHSWEPEDLNTLLAGVIELKPAVRCHDAYILKLVVSPDTKLVATASADHTAKIFRTSDMHQLKVLAKHQRWVWDLSFSADSAYLVTGSSDSTARLWDVSNGETVRSFSGHQKAVVSVCLNDIAKS